MSRVGIWRRDLASNALSLSPEAVRILELDGVEDHGITYDTILSRIHPEDREAVKQEYAHFLESHESSRIEHRVLLADGRIRYLEQSFESLLDDGERPLCLLGTLRDVTERRVLQRQLREARELVADAARGRSEFLARVNQGVHAAMAGVLGNTELLRETRLSPEQREAVEIITASGRNLLEQSNAVYDLSLIESGQLQLESTPFDLEKTAHEQFLALARQANEKGLELVLDYPVECPRRFYGDAPKVGRILRNLLSNGVRFADTGFVRLSVKYAKDVRLLRLQITDSGVGLDPRKWNALVKAFNEGPGAAGELASQGLGLTLAYALVRLMGGEISVDSSPSRGSCFTIELKLDLAGVDPVPALARFNANRVLLLEEQSKSARVMSGMLGALGLQSDCFNDSEAVLPALLQAVAEQRPYELAILNEPFYSSTTVVLGRAIRKLPELSGLRLLALTAQGHRGDADAFHRAGFDAYLNKPVLAATLSNVVQVLLERSSDDSQDEALLTSHQPEQDGEARAGRHHFEGRVLLVENDPASLHVASSMLTSLGLSVDLAENGLHAMLLSKKIDYDLIFMECMMPDMDVFEAVRLIREQEHEHRHPTAPIIALTPKIVREYRQECMQAGITDLIAKPYAKSDFIASLQQWLGVQAKPSLPDANASQRSMEATIDLGILERLSEEMAEDFAAVMEAILDEVGDALHKLGNGLQALPQRELSKLARGLISLCGNMGAMRLKRMASDLEQAAIHGFPHDPGPRVVAMQREFASVRRFLKEYGY